mgnify:CR=1 FL=1
MNFIYVYMVFNMNFNGATAEWVVNGTAGVFSAIQAQGVEISSGAQTLIDASEPGREFNLVPDVLTTIFLIVVLGMQMSSIWMKK